MLSRGVAPVARLARARTLCSVAPVSPLVEKVETLITKLKTADTSAVYDPATFSADLKAGKVDTGLLSSTMDFSDEYKKASLSAYMKITAMKNAASPAEPDWSKYEGTLDADMIASVKKMVAAEVEAVKSTLPEYTAELDASFDEFKKAVNGPGGLMEIAKTREAAAATGLTDIVAELEILKKDIAGVKTLTIAEILENEPELRKEVEAEIAEHNWAP